MPPKKNNKCSCREHDALSSSDSAVSNINSCKKFKISALKYLQERSLLQPYHKYLCEDCYSYALKSVSTEKYSIAEFCSKIESNEISENEYIQISTSYGKLLKTRLGGVVGDCSLDCLRSLNFETAIDKVDVGVRQFLKELTITSAKESKMQTLNAHESLVQLANRHYVGPLNFAKTVIAYFISGSRRIVEINAAFSPSGCYATVLEFLKYKAVSEQMLDVKRDCLYFFDNNQVMSRNWKVQYNCKALVSVVTTVVCLVPPTHSTIQMNENFMPGTWLSVGSIIDAKNLVNETGHMFRNERNDFISNEIIKLAQGRCNTIGLCKRRKVTFESGKPKPEPTEVDDPYADIPTFVSGKTEVVVLNPILVNPCSFQSLEVVLDDIILKANKPWIVVGCDGLPFNLCSKMFENYFVCPHCQQTFRKLPLFKSHVETYFLNVQLDECKKYNNILLIPGFGHLDINITKAFFKLLWKPCLSEMALLLGWRSLKALTACENCTDHHKATQMLNILFECLTRELLTPFITFCDHHNLPSTIDHLYNFVQNQHTKYIFLFKCNFTYLLAWKLFKKGMRRCNYHFMKMSLDKLSTLFYGLNMTVYMDLWFRFENMMVKAPPEVKEFIKNNICMSQSGHHSKAEGGDFILESTNKTIKSYMPHGVPTDERWTRVCQNLEHIDKIKNAIFSKDAANGDVPQPNKYFRRFNDEDAVREFSQMVRGYLSEEGELTCMDRKPLDRELIDFDLKCEANKVAYYESYPNVLRICERVFITPDDRDAHFDISNKSKADIQKIILNVLKEIDDAGGDEEAALLRHQWSTEVKKATKSVFLTFYREATQCLEEVTGRHLQEENDGEDE